MRKFTEYMSYKVWHKFGYIFCSGLLLLTAIRLVILLTPLRITLLYKCVSFLHVICTCIFTVFSIIEIACIVLSYRYCTKE